MVHFLELIYFLIIIKAILRCLYFWQLKEYRWDRFQTILKTTEIRQFFLPTRWFLKPRLTFKILLLIYLELYLTFFILRLPNQLWVVLLAYFSIPITITLLVLALKPLTFFGCFIQISLAKLKLKLRKQNLIVIGVTGSYGKTSTKEILAYLLTSKYKVLKTPGTINTAIGVAKTTLTNLKKHHQIFIVEMGAYTKGEIKQITNLVKPSIGILTGISLQHLQLFGSLENIVTAKAELIKSLPKGSLAVFNGQNPHSLKLAGNSPNLKTKIYYYPKNSYKTNLKGNFQQLNIQAAVIIAKHLKVSTSHIKKSLQSIPSFKTKLTQKKGLKNSIIVNDTYNSNPEGFKAAINLVKNTKADFKILISPGIIDLGKESKKIHRQLKKNAEKVFNQIIFTKKDLNYLNSEKTKNITNYKAILQNIKPFLNSKTLVLLEGRMPKKFIQSIC